MVVKAYKACIEERNVVNFIAVDYFEKIARYAVEAANNNNGGDPPSDPPAPPSTQEVIRNSWKNWWGGR